MIKSTITTALAAYIILNLPSVAWSQTTQGEVSTVSDDARLANFLQAKRALRASDESAFNAEQRSDFGQINAIIKSSKRDVPVNDQLSGASQNDVRELLLQDAATHLVNMGVKVKDVRAAERAGFDPLGAAIRFTKVQSTLEDRLLLAPLVLVGTVREVKFEDLDDGFGSTVIVDVTDWLSQGQAATRVEIRQMSGVDGIIYSSDISMPSAVPKLFALSSTAYELDAKRRGKAAKFANPATIRARLSGYDVFDVVDGQISNGPEKVSLNRAREIANVF